MSIFGDIFFIEECPECHRRRMEENCREIMQQYIKQFIRDDEQELKLLIHTQLDELAGKKG